MIINVLKLLKALSIDKTSYQAKQVRYALKGAKVLDNELIDKIIVKIKEESEKTIDILQSLKQ